MTSLLSHSTRKFIRREKSRLRRKFSHSSEAEEKIKELMERMFAVYGKKK